MALASWNDRQDQLPGDQWRWAWAGGDAGPSVQMRSGSAVDMAQAFEAESLEAWTHGQDLFVLPMSWVDQGYGALVSDMDSTLIVNESLDELAESVGVGQAVADITARSMRGELDFAQALAQRFALINGLFRADFVALGNTTRLSVGAEACITALVNAGVHCTLATGGFDMIAKAVVARLGMQDFVANSLAFDANDRFAQALDGPVLDARAKAVTLGQRQAQFAPKPCLAMGDGANDLEMIVQAEIGIAYRAKPIVREHAAYQLNYATLADVPFLLGIS